MDSEKFSLIQKTLLKAEDQAYKTFNAKLIPTVDKDRIIGIRIPTLRKMAKELLKKEPTLCDAFQKQLPHFYFEENNLHAFFIETLKDIDEALEATETFLPFIDNWETCDLFSPPLFKKYPKELFLKIQQWIHSDHPYTVRFAIGLLLSNYLDDYFDKTMIDLVTSIQSEEYYVNMMIAWYLSTALVKQYDTVIPLIQSKSLSPFIQNKTIQKAVESFRLSKEKKEYLKDFKIKTKAV